MLPLRTVVQHVVVVDSELLPTRERLDGADTGDVAEHRVVHLPELTVGPEAVLDLVAEAGSVLGGQPHVLRYVHPPVLAQHDPVAPILPVYPIRLQSIQSDLNIKVTG